MLFATSLPSTKPPTSDKTEGITRAQPSPNLAEALQDLPEELKALFYSLPELPPSAKTDPEAAFALYTLLSKLDPVMAKRWHWKDTRKVLRNLNIIAEYGRPASEVVVDTHASNAAQRCRYATASQSDRLLEGTDADLLIQIQRSRVLDLLRPIQPERPYR